MTKTLRLETRPITLPCIQGELLEISPTFTNPDLGSLVVTPEDLKALRAIAEFAEDRGIPDRLGESILALSIFGGTPEYSKCLLWKDHAFMSMQFQLFRCMDNDSGLLPWLSGALIYDGPFARCDGSYPQLSVHVGSSSKEGCWLICT